jgi:multiple antibiotic resistance protein
MDSFTRSFLLLLVLLNPFIMSVYLLDLVRALDFRRFSTQLIRAGLISFVVFALFAWTGETVFADVMQVRFFAFLIFGGITFLIIGIRLLGQTSPSRPLPPQDEQVAASIAMPYIVGPGTISASVLAGARLDEPRAQVAIALALAVSIAGIIVFKLVYDIVHARNERLVQRYVEIAGRATGLFAGSFAIDMILRGLEGWIDVVRG